MCIMTQGPKPLLRDDKKWGEQGRGRTGVDFTLSFRRMGSLRAGNVSHSSLSPSTQSNARLTGGVNLYHVGDGSSEHKQDRKDANRSAVCPRAHDAA